MTVPALSAWLLSVMLTTVPPGGARYPKEAQETAEQGKARYSAIADAVARATFDPEETPLFAGKHGRAKTALLLLTVSLHESHWRRHIDLGLGPIALRGRGTYHCMMQILVPDDRTPEGWSADDLVHNREKCFRRALHIMQQGKAYCDAHDFGPRSFLNQYGSGRCDGGKKPVSLRWRTFDRLLSEHPPYKPAETKAPNKSANTNKPNTPNKPPNHSAKPGNQPNKPGGAKKPGPSGDTHKPSRKPPSPSARRKGSPPRHS